MNPFDALPNAKKANANDPFANIGESQKLSDSIWNKIGQGAKSFVGGVASGVGGIGLTAVDYLGKKAVNTFGTDQMKQNIANSPSLNEEFNQQFGQKENPTAFGIGQLTGEIGALAAPVSTIGKGAKIAAETMGAGSKVAKLTQAGAEGAAFTAGVGLTENKSQSLEDYALNTGLNIAFPGAGMIAKSVGEKMPARIVNSLIKPLLKDFAYGKDPGGTVAKLGITGNNFDELISNIQSKKNEIGEKIGSIISQSRSPLPIDLVQTLKPIDEALTKASFTPRVNASLLQRLDNVKADLQEIAQKGDTIQAAQDFKKVIGDMTKWTGNMSDDQAINKALKQAYGRVIGSMDEALQKTLTPEEFSAYKEATKQYGDLMSAENASIYRDKIQERQNIISFGAKNAGFITALGTAIATGGASIPTVLAGLGGIAVDKSMASPAFKTRLASLLSKLAPKEVSTFFEKVPTAKQLFKDEEIKSFVQEPKGGLAIKDVTKTIPKDLTPLKIAQEITDEEYASLLKYFKDSNSIENNLNLTFLERYGLNGLDYRVLDPFLKKVLEEVDNLPLPNGAEKRIRSLTK